MPIRRAYPVIPELVCVETQEYDYRSPAPDGDRTPIEVYTEARMLVHKLMRLSAGERAHWLTEEVLELQRESVTAQLAFALDAYERCVGQSLAD